MAVVEIDIKDLENLTGKKLSKDLLEKEIPMLGCEFEHLDSEKVSYDVPPDRPDMLSTEGFARALRYFLGEDKGLQKYKVKRNKIKMKKQKVKARPNITAAAVNNIEITEKSLQSIMQLQEKLHTTMGRNRKKLAIGIHDMDKVEPPFTYKAVKPNKFSFKPLGWDKELTLKEIKEKHEKGKYVEILEETGSKKWPVITDKNQETLSFPPVINGKKTELTSQTENVFIDVTGTDQETVEKALNIVVTALTERGGEINTVKIEGIGERPRLNPEEIKIDLEYVNKMLGTDFQDKQFKEYIKGMGYGFKGKTGMGYSPEKTILVPPYRNDIMHPIDVVEDIAIRHGYEEFKPEIPKIATIGKPDKKTEKEEKVKEILIGLGYQEVLNMVLTNKENQFKKMNRKEPKNDLVELENPLDEKHTICRKIALPQLLKNISNNQHVSYPQKIFEVAKCLGTKGKTKTKLSIAKADIEVNYNEATATLDSIMRNLNKEYELKEIKDPSFMEGRRAKITNGEEEIGIIGEIHPKVLNNWGIEKPVIAMELNLGKIL